MTSGHKKKIAQVRKLAGAFFCIAIGCVSRLSAQPFQPLPTPQGTQVIRNLSYLPEGGARRTLDLYLPTSAVRPPPLVIWIHGGGWVRGDKESIGGLGPYLVRLGYAVASVDYRLTSEATFPAQINDCRAAVRWLRSNAGTYGFDPDHFAAWGSSAGGYLAALLGTGDSSSKELEEAERVQAVVDFCGPPDLLALARAPIPNSPGNRSMNAEVAALIGGPPSLNPDGALRASPIAHVAKGEPPFLIIHGSADRIVPFSQSERFAEALRKAGVPVALRVVPGAGHDRDFGRQGMEWAFNFLQWILRQAPGASSPFSQCGRYPVHLHPTPPPPGPVVTAKPNIIQDGDRELLTFESEKDVQALARRWSEDRAAPLRPGVFTVHYFRSGMDGSVQPYALWLPSGYRPDRKWPLLVQLHGIKWIKTLAGDRMEWKGMHASDWIAPDAPVAVLQCFGRGDSFFEGMGEQDVLEAIAEVERRAAIDRNRIFIMGHSMGGAGAYLVGLHYPDRFGSITAIDPALGFADPVDDPSRLPGWMRPQVSMYRPENLFPNAADIPVYFKNAGAARRTAVADPALFLNYPYAMLRNLGVGLQRDSTRFTDGIVTAGGFSTTESFLGMPHNFAAIIPFSVFTGEAVARPVERHPAEIGFFTDTLRYNRAYWVTIDQLEAPGMGAHITAIYDDGRPKWPFGRMAADSDGTEKPHAAITIRTTGIAALTLRLREAGVPAGATAPLTVDGRTVASGPLPAVVYLARSAEGDWRLVKTPENTTGKRHGLQGPIGDAFLSRFLAVYGTGDRDLAIAELDAIRDPPDRLSLQGEFPMKPADKVTAADIASSNLILFGTPRSNSVLRRLAPDLPKPLMDRIGTSSAVVFIQPNPENPARYVVVWTGPLLSALADRITAGFVPPLELLPDYVVVKDGKVADAGLFDNDWHLPPGALDILP